MMVTSPFRGPPVYHYYLKDHLGNNRMVVRAGGTVEQTNSYYLKKEIHKKITHLIFWFINRSRLDFVIDETCQVQTTFMVSERKA